MLSKSRLRKLIQDNQTLTIALENYERDMDKLSNPNKERAIVNVIKRVDLLSKMLKKAINYHE